MFKNVASPLLSLEVVLEQISNITLQIQQCRALGAIVQPAIADARTLLQTDRIFIYRCDADQDVGVVFEAGGSDCRSLMGQPIRHLCADLAWLKSYRYAQITPEGAVPAPMVSIADSAAAPVSISSDGAEPIRWLDELHVKAYVVLPLLSQGTAWGLLIVHHCREARTWQSLEIHYLQQIAMHLGLAIQQANWQQTETTLQEHKSRYRLLTELTSDYTYRLDVAPDGMLCGAMVTDQFTQMTGFALSEIQEMSKWQQFIHPDDLPQVIQFFQAIIQTGQTDETEVRFVTKNGQQLWINLFARPEFDASGKTIIAVNGAAKNITERKRREEFIQNIAAGVSAATGEAFFYSLVEYLQQLLNMAHVFVSELVLPNCDRVRIIAGISNGQRVDGIEYELAGSPCEQVVQQGFCLFCDDVQQCFPDDRYLEDIGVVSYVGIPLLDSNGTVMGLMCVSDEQAITEAQFIEEVLTIFAVRAASELERQRSEALLHQYERIVSATPDCIALIDRDYTCKVVNQALLSWYQKTAEEVIGHSIAELIGQVQFEPFCRELCDRTLTAGLTHEFEDWRYFNDGQSRFIRCSLAPYVELDGSISGVVINWHDLTELQQAERENRSLRERLQFLLSANPAVLYSCQASGAFSCTFISDNVATLLGYTPTDFLAEPDFWMKRLHPDDVSNIIDGVPILFEQGYHTHEYRFLHRDGHYCWIQDDLKLVKNSAGEPIELVGCLLSIDDRKAAEATLRKQLQLTEQMAESTLAILYVYDLIEQRNVYCNSQIETVLGYSAAEIQAMGPTFLSDLLHPDDVADVFTQHQQLFQLDDDDYIEIEYRLRHKNGDYRWLLSRDRIFKRTPDGMPIHISGVAVDVTLLKETQAALCQQIEREQLLAGIAHHIRQTLDLDNILHTTVTEVRRCLQADRVLIYRFNSDWSGIVIAESVEEGWISLLGQHITDTYFAETQGKQYEQGRIKVTHNVQTANLDPCHLDLLEQIQVKAKLVVPILQSDHLWGLLVAQQCDSPRQWQDWEIDLQQQLATQIAIAIQQSELYQQVHRLNTGLEAQVKQRTNELQQALDFEALLKRITDRVRDSLDERQILQAAVEELAHKLTLAGCDAGIYNPEHTTSTIAYEAINTLAPAQGQTFEIANAPYASVYTCLLSRQVCQFCDTVPNPLRQNQRHLTILAVPMCDDQETLGDLWLFRPPHKVFTESEIRLVQQVASQCAIALRQSRLYQAAQEQVEELERLNRLKDDFLSTVSHELRTPMSNIKMATHMLEVSLSHLGVLSSETSPINRYVKVLQEEEEREISLINDLLDLARLDAGVEELSLSSIDLQFYLPHLAEAFTERAQQQQQQLVFQIASELPSITTDLPYLERIISELLNNACKYTPAGGIITVAAQMMTDQLEVRISNSGTEIAAAECDRIFDKFYRIPNNDPWKHGGTGLGLALVKKLTERLGGTIQVESGDGQTTFILSFTLNLLTNASTGFTLAPELPDDTPFS